MAWRPSRSRRVSFCGHGILGERPLLVEDARADPRFAGNPIVDGPPQMVFYLGLPLRVGGDRLPVGTLCLVDHRALTAEIHGMLAAALAAAVPGDDGPELR